jgi:hypothetical protein
MQLGPISKSQFEHIVTEMDANGYAVLPEMFSTAEIAEARRFVEDEVARHQGQYFSFIGREPVTGTLFERIGDLSWFRDLLADLSAHVLGRKVSPGAPFQVLRVVAGETGLGQSMLFHYDAYVITALVPVAIPQNSGEPRGDLILYPQLRPIRSNVVANVLEKAVMQNRVAWNVMATKLMQRLFKAKVLKMEPGNIYFFRGYQSLHANEPCLPSSLRATALYHFGDPYENNALTVFIQRVRKWREARKARACRVQSETDVNQ